MGTSKDNKPKSDTKLAWDWLINPDKIESPKAGQKDEKSEPEAKEGTEQPEKDQD